MESLSDTFQENTTKKHPKIRYSQLDVSRKVIAFDEIFSLPNNERSAREIAKILCVPNSTMQSWRSREVAETLPPEVEEFLATWAGKEFLQRIVTSAYQVIHFGSGGIRGVQEFLVLSRLGCVVASSYGALQAFSIRCEEYLVAFGEMQEELLASKMKKRKITAGLDEVFRGNRPCLVAIDVVSNYILLEKFTKDRKSETWSTELKPRLAGLNVELGQVVSDLCRGIRTSTEQLKATHIPEIFHAQYEISKATSGALASQEREFEVLAKDAEEKLKKIVAKHGEKSDKAKKAVGMRNLRRFGLEQRRERRKIVREAKKELGRIHHPIDLSTGKLQTAETVKARFDAQFDIIEEAAKQACLSGTSFNRLKKAKRVFDAIVGYLKFYFCFYKAFVEGLGLDLSQEKYFNTVIFPLSYLEMIWKRLPRKERESLKELKEEIELKLDAPPWTEEQIKEWRVKGRECAEIFQRSSSCVEGRNGALSLYHHRFHRMSARSLKALTVIHNFHTKRFDKTTAAQRFFGVEHENLFESLIANVRIPGRPQHQHHDPEKRQLGWNKRRAA